MSLSSLLSVARTALLTHQKGLGVTSHNIANAQTPGFSRQRLEVRAGPSLRTPSGAIGTGVTDSGVDRVRDSFLDAALRREAGLLGFSNSTKNLLSGVERIFGEPTDAGLGSVLGSFFDAFSDLANDPSSLATRTLTQEAGRAVANRFNSLAGALSQSSLEATAQLQDAIVEVNNTLREIAQLNTEIVAAGGANQSAPDLEDRRDSLIDSLAQTAGLKALKRSNGSVAVILGDRLMVDGAMAQQLEIRSLPSGGVGVGVIGSPTVMVPGDGTLSSLTGFISSTLPDIRTTLDQLAAEFVTAVNTLHTSGSAPDGTTGIPFFEPTGTTAQTVQLSAAVAASPNNIATGLTAAPGDNSVALQIAELRTTGLPALGGATVGEFYISTVSTVGVLTRNAESQATISDILVAGLENRRAAISGVSIDEELVIMIGQQQAFSAAARIVTTVDEMMQDLLRIV